MTTTTQNQTEAEHAQFHLPQKPYSVVDAINRNAAAQGSVEWAQKAEYGDYNGHHVTVSWNSYRGYYICEYYWGQRVVIARGSAPEVLRAAVREFNDVQGRGACLSVTVKHEDAHWAEQLGLVAGAEDHAAKAWWTPLHDKVSDAAFWERSGMGVPGFLFLATSKSVEEYEAKKEAHLAKRRAAAQPERGAS